MKKISLGYTKFRAFYALPTVYKLLELYNIDIQEDPFDNHLFRFLPVEQLMFSITPDEKLMYDSIYGIIYAE